jgi:uncharacterized protein (TIGR00661 family)
MRILYGIQLTGNGHIVRSRDIVRGLRTMGHEVRVLMSGPSKPAWQYEPFEPYETRHGLTFVSRAGRLSYLRTALGLRPIRYLRDLFGLDLDDVDLVVTDYEPISAWAGRLKGKPTLGVGHLYAFHDRIPIAGANPLASFVTRQFAPARYRAPMHWHHFEQRILPPSIPPDLPPPRPPVPGKILVYLPFESLDDITGFVGPWKDYRFHVYWHLQAPEDRGHVLLRPLSRDGFVADLADCEGVICNAGFSLVSEALHLGKKVLAKPLVRQMEQESNARALDELGLGATMHSLDREALRSWLGRPGIRPRAYPDVMGLLTRAIAAGEPRDFDARLEDLVRVAWRDVPT